MASYDKYRRKSHRLKYWNYSYKGIYFITINTKYGKNYFGKIINNKMILNDSGKIAEKYWKEIPKHFDNAKLDEFIIMPNHIHGIIILEYKNEIDKYGHLIEEKSRNNRKEKRAINNEKGINEKGINEKGIVAVQRWYRCSTATSPFDDEPISPFDDDYLLNAPEKNNYFSEISPASKSLSVIIRSYKSICTREINKIKKDIRFKWHKGYYDIVINKKGLKGVRRYIIDNPENWR